jgi:N-acetylmuramic acid 6-phosphate (MurNAc-6-P) etherase
MASKTPMATERRNSRTHGLDKKSTLDILRAIHREDAAVAKAVAGALPTIARAVDVITRALRTSRGTRCR